MTRAASLAVAKRQQRKRKPSSLNTTLGSSSSSSSNDGQASITDSSSSSGSSSNTEGSASSSSIADGGGSQTSPQHDGHDSRAIPVGGQLTEGILRAFQGTSPSLVGDLWLAAGERHFKSKLLRNSDEK